MNVDPGRETPLFVQIAESIEDDVFTGLYVEGDRVPSTNEVAALFEGIIHKRRGMGMFVSDGALERIRSKRQAAFFERYVEALVAEAGKLGMGKAQVLALVEKGFDHE